MKALSIHQPWAQLVVIGAKQYETRKWKTSHRGRVLIHAARKFMEPARSLMMIGQFNKALSPVGFKSPTDLPLGGFVGVATIEDCIETARLRHEDAISKDEDAFGDFRPGRWAWRLSDPQMFKTPINYQGSLGLFDVPEERLRDALEWTGQMHLWSLFDGSDTVSE